MGFKGLCVTLSGPRPDPYGFLVLSKFQPRHAEHVEVCILPPQTPGPASDTAWSSRLRSAAKRVWHAGLVPGFGGAGGGFWVRVQVQVYVRVLVLVEEQPAHGR